MKKTLQAQLYSLAKNKLFTWGIFFVFILITIILCCSVYVQGSDSNLPGAPLQPPFDAQNELQQLTLKKNFALYNIYYHEGKDLDEVKALLPPGTMVILIDYQTALRDYNIADYWLNHFDQYEEYYDSLFNWKESFSFEYTPNNSDRSAVMMLRVANLSIFIIVAFSFIVALYVVSYDIKLSTIKNFAAGNNQLIDYVFSTMLICGALVTFISLIPLAFCYGYAAIQPTNHIVIYVAGKVRVVTAFSLFVAQVVFNYILGVTISELTVIATLYFKKWWKSLCVIFVPLMGLYFIGNLLKIIIGQNISVLRCVPVYNFFNYNYGFADPLYWGNIILLVIILLVSMTIYYRKNPLINLDKL